MTFEPVSVAFTDAAFGGEAIGHLPDGRVVFVPRALPGETALVRVQQERRDFARAEVAVLEEVAPGRVAPPCPYFTAGCGGCSWQHAEYALQLQLKEAIVIDQLRRIGHFADADELVRPAIGMLEPWHYRNQARFTVGRRFGELCFTYRASHRLLRIEHCWITHPRITLHGQNTNWTASTWGRLSLGSAIGGSAGTAAQVVTTTTPRVAASFASSTAIGVKAVIGRCAISSTPATTCEREGPWC